MPAISYSKQNIKNHDFKNKILNGIKIHTIRQHRKRPFKIGDILFHYENWRSPEVEMFHTNKCLYLEDIKITKCREGCRVVLWILIGNFYIISEDELNTLAINDGFDNYEDFKNYFIKSGLPFKGQIIGWKEGINYAYK
jgi:hypothetical protein